MTDTRYAPPVASVVDAPAETPSARPAQVTLAVLLLLAQYTLGLLFQNDFERSVFYVSSIATALFLIWKIAKGRNWARIAIMAVTAMSWLGMIVALSRGETFPLVAYVRRALQIVSVALLCLGSGAAWFRSLRTLAKQ